MVFINDKKNKKKQKKKKKFNHVQCFMNFEIVQVNDIEYIENFTFRL